MKVLAILQNQWFKDPERVRQIVAEMETRRERRRWDHAMLFFGCLTGRRLKAAFGGDEVNEWETTNASPMIGGQASARFPADPEHIMAEIADVQPDVVLTFGKVAGDAFLVKPGGVAIWTGPLIQGPHPAARPPINAVAELRRMAAELRALTLAPGPDGV